MERQPRLDFRQFAPVRHERRFFHVNVEHGRVFSERPNLFRFAFRRDCAVFIQIGSMRNDQQAGFGGNHIGRDVVCALEQQLASSLDDFQPAHNTSKSGHSVVL